MKTVFDKNENFTFVRLLVDSAQDKPNKNAMIFHKFFHFSED